MTWGKPQVAEEPSYRLCRGHHLWRVTEFDYLAGVMTETCTACGETKERVVEAIVRARKPKNKRGAR